MRTKVFTAILAGLMLALVVGIRGDAARAQQKGGNDNASQSSQKSGQTKHVFVGRGSDTAQGSRVTIKSDNPLNDYSAYRSGDRFYVVLPRAAAGSVGRGGAGKGYSDMQVQQRGDSVVLSYHVQPGAKPRVEQKFNRLDVVFDSPDGGQSNTAQSNGTQSGGSERTTNESEGSNASGRNGGQAQQTNGAQNSSSQSDRRNNESAENARQQNPGAQNTAAQNSTAQNSAAQNSGSQNAVVPSLTNPQANGVEQGAQNSAATTEATPDATPSIDQSQVAQNQQPNPVAPITTTNAGPAAATGVSFGTYVLNHWPVALFVALFVVGLGLIIASRRSAPAQPDWLEESKAATTETLAESRAAKLESAPVEPNLATASKSGAAEVSTASDSATLAAASTLAAAPAVVRVGKDSRKSRKAKKKQEARERKKQAAEAPLAESSLASAANGRAAAKQAAAEAESTTVSEAAAVGAASSAVAEATAVEPVTAEPVAAESTVAESPAVESHAAAEQAAVVEPPVLVEQPVAAEPPVTAEPSAEEHPTATTVVEPSPAASAEPSKAEPSPTATAEPSVTSAEPVVSAESVAAVELVAGAAVLAGVAAVESTELEVVQPEVQSHETVQAEERQTEVKQVEARQVEAAPSTAPSTEVAPPSVTLDPEAAQAQARRLIEGGEYDRAVLSTTDSMARQMIAYELLAALATRNFERRERARAAFVEHGYFDETARDLREAEASAERASAARSLALVGRREATPHLVAALEDSSVDVRRAAVEALGSLRDPAAIAPLEALIPRERQLRNGIPSRIIRNAIEPCRETAEQEEQAAAAQAESAAKVAHAPDAATSTEPATSESATTELTPTETATAELIPTETSAISPFVVGAREEEETTHEAEAHAFAFETPSAVEKTTAVLPFESSPEDETAVEAAHASEKTAEIAPFDESVATIHTSGAESKLKALEAELEEFGGVESFDDSAHAHEVVQFDEVAHAPEESRLDDSRAIEVSHEESQPSEPMTSAIEHVGEETHAADSSGFEFYVSEPSVAEERSLQHVEEPEAVVAGKEPARAREEASEWIEFDVDEKSFEPEPTAVEPSAHVFEASSGEALSHAAHELATPVEETRAVEPSSAVEETSTQVESRRESSFNAGESRAQAGAAEEKGVVPFDEFSTVPASIQQRLASLVPSERAAAITELSHVDSDEAFQQICSAFDDDAKEVRSAAARALYDLREDRADSFTRALREATPERRRHVGSAISTSGIASEAISQLTGESREKTYEAFSLLFLMAKAGEVQPLLRAIEGHPNNEVRLAVVKLLALSGQKEVLPAFRRLAVRGSLPTEVRSALMEAIYQISSSGQPVA
jgi:HEAT repeat protein